MASRGSWPARRRQPKSRAARRRRAARSPPRRPRPRRSGPAGRARPPPGARRRAPPPFAGRAATAGRRRRRRGARGGKDRRGRERAEGGVDPSRRPKLLPGLGEGDRVAQRRLVLAPVEQVLRPPRRRFSAPGGGARPRPMAGRIRTTESSAESAAPAKNRASASEFSRKDPPGRAQAGARGGSKGAGSARIIDANRSRRRRLWPPLAAESAPPVEQNSMSDKVALSDVMLFIVNHARFEPANRRKPPPGALRTA